MLTLVNGFQHIGSQEYADTRFIKIVGNFYFISNGISLKFVNLLVFVLWII